MRAYRWLFFDFDGTVCNTYPGIVDVLDETFAHYGARVARSDYPKFIGPPLSDTFAERIGADRAYEAVEYFRARYDDTGAIFKTVLYEGIPECFRALTAAGYRLGVATCKKHEEAEKLLRRFDLLRYVSVLSGLCYNKRESKRDVLAYGAAQAGAAIADCLMIGDTVYDAEGAEALGMDCALCLWGFGDYEAIRGANVVLRAQTPAALTEALLAARRERRDLCDILE